VPEKPKSELMGGLHESISRRRMLKRIGTGAAIAWSAPILTSLTTPAFAQYPPPRCDPTTCDGDCIGGFTQCGNCDIDFAEICACDVDTEARCSCFCGGVTCATLTPCADSSDCNGGERCFVGTCCSGGVCIPPCDGGYRPERTTARAAHGLGPLGPR